MPWTGLRAEAATRSPRETRYCGSDVVVTVVLAVSPACFT
jgi:hypothetical protein